VAWAPERLPDPAPANRQPARVRSRLPRVRDGLAEYAAAPPLQVLRWLESSRHGLTEDEAQARLIQFGDNAIAPGRAPTWSAGIGTAASSPFVLVLGVLALVSAVTGELDGAAVITTMALVSCLLRIRQEYRSDLAAQALRAVLASTATVRRRAADGRPGVARELPVDQLVPGDIVHLLPGDVVPADLRLLRSDQLAVNQAVITGESLPAAKRGSSVVADDSYQVDEGGTLFDSPVLCFMGTNVQSGSGTAVVVATAASAYLGSTHQEAPARAAETSFDRGARGVSWLLVWFMLVCVPIVLAVNAAIRGQPLEAFLFAIAVAVGLTPEMLPVVVTTALARGARVLAGQAAIVKRLPAIHNLGAMDVLCTDKTGTLTQDQVSVACTVDPLGRDDPDVLHWSCVNSYWSAEVAGQAITEVLDQVLLSHAADLGVTAYDADVLVGVVPFDVSRRRATVLIRRPGSLTAQTLITKGAAEEVLGCCTQIRVDGVAVPLGAPERARLLARSEEYARDGVRLLAVASATRQSWPGSCGPAVETDLTLLGFVGFRDPPRSSARAALAGLTGLGIAVKVVTGDHPLAAARICRDIGIAAGQPVTGQEIDRLDDAALGELARSTTIFARVDPAQKARIVRALRADGATVGFLGDGLNDTAALREADVGISVDGAVPAAMKCADVILLRKDLTTLHQAVIQGRRTFGNIVKYLKITVSANVGNALSMLVASAVLPFLPMLPVQVLVQNLCFDLCQLSLAFDTVDEPSLRGPRTFDRRDLTRFVVCFGPINMLADLVTFVILWRLIGHHDSLAGRAVFRSGWLAENLLTQAAAVHLLRSRSLPSPGRLAARPVLLATLALALAGLCLPFSPFASLLGLSALPAAYFLPLTAVLVGYCVATVAAKSGYLARSARWL